MKEIASLQDFKPAQVWRPEVMMTTFILNLIPLIFMLVVIRFMVGLAKPLLAEKKGGKTGVKKAHGEKLGVPKPSLETEKPKIEKVASEEEIKEQQKKDIWAEAYELWKAVSRGSTIAGKPCDCGFKHAIALRYNVDEIPMPEIEKSLSKLRTAAQMVIDYSKGHEPYTIIPSEEKKKEIMSLLREGRKGLWEQKEEPTEWGKGILHRKIWEKAKERKA